MKIHALSYKKITTLKQQPPTIATSCSTVKFALKLCLLAFATILSAQAHSDSISASEAAALYDAETTYSIYRKGKSIGKHNLKINTSGTRIEVSVDSRITIRILKVPIFKFSYVSNEIWDNNQLLSVQSSTKTNKEVEVAELANTNDTSTLKNNDTDMKVPLIRYATNHWHIGAVEQARLFNTVKGTLGNVAVQKVDNETLQIGDTSLSVTQYKYTGDIIAESWYDANNRWVKLAFLGSDGSKITYVIDNP